MSNISLLEVTFPIENSPNTFTMRYPLSTMTAYKISRDDLVKAKNIPGIVRPGVYVLFGNDTIYIGQTRNGIHRIEDHNRTKDFWEYAILFLAEPKDFTLNIISGLEVTMINDAIKRSPYRVYNNEVPQYKSPTEYEKSVISSVYKDILFIMNFNNIKTQNATVSPDICVTSGNSKKYSSYKKPFTFNDLKIPTGSKLLFKEDPTVEVIVVDDTHIMYEGRVTSINALSKELKKVNYAVTGRALWTYNGKTLQEIRDEISLKN